MVPCSEISPNLSIPVGVRIGHFKAPYEATDLAPTADLVSIGLSRNEVLMEKGNADGVKEFWPPWSPFWVFRDNIVKKCLCPSYLPGWEVHSSGVRLPAPV